MPRLFLLLSCVLIFGCSGSVPVPDRVPEGTASQSSDTLPPEIVCSPPRVTAHGKGEASSIICEVIDPPAAEDAPAG